MQIIKVDAIDSTNTFLRNLNRDTLQKDPICVVARRQYSGKGQMGTTWESNAGENLTCSVFMPISGLPLHEQFYLSKAASLAVCDTLHALKVPQVFIKWPNDILSEKKKVCGILLENSINNGSLIGVIIGIGLNVNQTEFLNLPKAGSLKQSLQKSLSIKQLLQSLLANIEQRFCRFEQKDLEELKMAYEALLFKKNKPCTFSNQQGTLFTGIIKNVTPTGKLNVQLEDDSFRSFDLKQIQMLY